jgi:SAM-dependent methyltransferase
LLEEWLKGMVSLGYVLCDSRGKRFHFPPEHAAVLADEGSPYFKGGMVEYAIPAVLASHKVMEAFRTGIPITPDVFHADYWEAIERWGAPDYRHRLVQQWLPLMPDVFRRLQSGGEVADVGCGSGRATITIAKAFPKTLTRGFDVFGPAIERAQKNAEAAGMADRATFVVGGTDMLPEGQFDLITNFWVFHHYTHPVTEMKVIRRALAPNGSYLIAEDQVSSNPIENINPIGRVAYGASTLGCLHDSMADNGVGIGMASEEVVRQLGEQAGFAMIRRLPLDDPYLALYELRG